ncbi:MAG: FeoA family protein [Vicinamibacteraceae bacterium]
MSANFSLAQPIPLSQLRAGSTARLHSAELAKDDCALLKALGLTDRCLLRVCKAGEPCIVEVKATRIGLSRSLARGVFVVPEALA